MKTEKNILIAFILNLSFSVFEFIGGIFTGSVAIISDAIHDIGDAASIGLSYFLEKKSKKKPDEKYTYGYIRFSVMGSIITNFILLFGSMMVIYNAIKRIINPVEINYNGMILFAVVGVCVNFCAAFFTREGGSMNQKAVNLHMLEDVLGWAVVLFGAIIMRFTDISVIDPLMSMGVAIFIFINAIKNLREIIDLFLEKTPRGIDINEIKDHLLEIEGVSDVHHIHVRSIDGQSNYATMHIVTNADSHHIKEKIREELSEHGICHATLELEGEMEHCHDKCCHVEFNGASNHHHHHHH
ncbi:MAG: cation transporter [Clostridia bacterium]|nr:cation transporter [Clostridia bacterium]